MKQIHTRPERSPDLFVDGADVTALKAKSQYGDNTSTRFAGFSHKEDFVDRQITDGEADEGSILNHENEEVLPNSPDGLSGKLVSKRFNEFVGKRSGISEDLPFGSSGEDNLLDRLNTLGVLVSLPKNSPEEQQKNAFDQDNVDNHMAMKHIIRGLYNELNDDDEVSKRQYEFVGKRNYDFVGKRSYDFLGKRHQNDFIGKRYDFLGKRSPYDFLGKKSYDFLGKRSPYEFVGKRRQDGDVSGSIFRTNSPSPAAEYEYQLFQHSRMPDQHSQNLKEFGDVSKRYSEFLGKRKRSMDNEDSSLSNSERLAALLQNNGLRKRLSRMLLNDRLVENYPGFIGK